MTVFRTRSYRPWAHAALPLALLLGGSLSGLMAHAQTAHAVATTPAGKPQAPAPQVPAPQPPPATPGAAPAPTPPGAAPAPAGAPDVRIEYFGAEGGYTVGSSSVTFLCVARNAGTGPLPEGAVALRCLPVSGLDYTTGNLTPRLPALAPGSAVAYRWRLVPLDKKSPLIAALLVSGETGEKRKAEEASNTGGLQNSTAKIQNPDTMLAVVPRFADAPVSISSTLDAAPAPTAVQSEDRAALGNDVVALRVVRAQNQAPVLLLAAREGAEWQTLASSAALLTVTAGEGGQRPWRETLRWQTAQVQQSDDMAALTLTGRLGHRWRSEIRLEAKRNTCVIEGRIRLKAVRPVRLYNVSLPRMLARVRTLAPAVKSDGTPAPLPPAPDLLAESPNLAAWHEGSSTFGLSWLLAPRSGWTATKLGVGDPGSAPVLAAAFTGPANGEAISAGTVVEFTFRLFAFSPSGTIRDAVRFVAP